MHPLEERLRPSRLPDRAITKITMCIHFDCFTLPLKLWTTGNDENGYAVYIFNPGFGLMTYLSCEDIQAMFAKAVVVKTAVYMTC
jgi:hypothetical protein